MFKGHLDGITSQGEFLGWAYELARPDMPLLVSIQDHLRKELAYGLAHIYREDLAAAKCGIGWCSFRLRGTTDLDQLKLGPLSLVARETAQEIHRAENLRHLGDPELLLNSVGAITGFDPTALHSIEALSGCDQIFDNFLKTRGVDAYVRTAYVYILGRPADPDGLRLYGKLIRQGFISPYLLLHTLSESTEFRSRPRFLIAPNMVGFPFRCV
jgi:hypothetical protein